MSQIWPILLFDHSVMLSIYRERPLKEVLHWNGCWHKTSILWGNLVVAGMSASVFIFAWISDENWANKLFVDNVFSRMSQRSTRLVPPSSPAIQTSLVEVYYIVYCLVESALDAYPRKYDGDVPTRWDSTRSRVELHIFGIGYDW